MANPGKNSAEKVTEKVEPDETPEPSVPPSAESVPPAITEQSAAGQTLQPQAEENSKQGTFNVTLMKMNEAKIEGFQGWLNRDNMPDKVNLEANGLTVGPDGFSANGNASNWSAGVTRSQQANPEGNTSKNTRSSS
ncbi:hypothetical protein DDE82_002830 [Stemphylium lycopersici]|uniref:Uncharacterized protein n=1 Tax=Stemphylium lycopersici TaxID=183478 RepID=A0A364MWA0_STELY|nr:hypothetical protein TW65_05989 [Stemphylium lycopersici]RAR05399.1 hypothetical protein DDE83_007378 [Stemphylium lycopersici]RAR07544.1 hypothetical protein DDE82_002830 [Stemphylium lycopersici]